MIAATVSRISSICFLLFCVISLGNSRPVCGQETKSNIPKADSASAMAAANIGRSMPSEISGGSSAVPDLFTGSLTTTVPIELPRGRSGLQPSIRLLYRNSEISGMIGVGWELDIGSIERSSKRGVDYNSDAYVYKASSGGVDLIHLDGPDYRAEIEDGFLRFRKLLGTDGLPYWEVTDKTGRKYIYGETANERLDNPNDKSQIFRWGLTRVVDTHKNFFILSYFKSAGQIYPDEIQYTGAPGIPPTIRVKFVRTTRQDQFVSYSTNFGVKTEFRLNRIEISANGVGIRNYELNYGGPALPSGQSLSTGRSLLTSVKLSSGDSKDSLPPVEFDYQTPTGGWQTQSWGAGTGPQHENYISCLMGDFDGDGRTDIACSAEAAGTWDVALSTGVGWRTAAWGGGTRAKGIISHQCMTGDFNGDGKTDIACHVGYGNWDVALSTGTGWQTSVWNAGYDPGMPPQSRCTTGDFNGDGKTDIACETLLGVWSVAISTGSGFQTELWNGGPRSELPIYSQCVTSDFNGDGKADIACYSGANGVWNVGLSTGNGWQTSSWAGGPSPQAEVLYQCLIGDFNGDGRTDIACNSRGTGNWNVGLSTGSGWQTTLWTGPNPDIPVSKVCVTGDFNGDGKTDIGCYVGENGTGTWNIGLSTGVEWQARIWTAGPQPEVPVVARCTTGDFNGDGKTDIACYTGRNYVWQIGLSSGEAVDLLSKIHNVTGGSSTIQYTSSTTYSNRLLPIPVQTVSSITSDDGRGNVRTNELKYQDGFFFVPERDFRGFGTVQELSPPDANGIRLIRETKFHQGNDTDGKNEPNVAIGYMKGRPYVLKISDSTGRVYSTTTSSYLKAANRAPYYTPIAQLDSLTCGLQKCDKRIRFMYQYDGYGNKVRELDYGDLDDPDDDRTIVREFSVNEDAWIVGLQFREYIYKGIGDGGEKVFGSEFFYDDAADCSVPSNNQTPRIGDLTRVVPWSSQKLQAEQRLGYDSWGNVVCKSDTLGHISKFSYDPTHTFVTSITDTMGHETKIQYYGVDGQSSNSGLYGQLENVIDPNGATNYTSYDSFGRRVRLSFPGGGSTTYFYSGLGNPVTQNIRTESELGIFSIEYFDGLGRSYLRKDSGANHQVVDSETWYDERGFVSRTSLPFVERTERPSYESYQYDPLGRVVRVHHGDGSERFSCYDAWEVIIADENMHISRRTFDAHSSLVGVTEFVGKFPSCDATQEAKPYATTKYRYDVLGRPVEVIDAKNNHTIIHYDALGRRTMVSDPDLGVWKYIYDADGSLTQQTDALGHNIYLRYDALNRVTQKDYGTQKPFGHGDIVYQYDGQIPFGVGRLLSVKGRAYEKRFSYDAEGRVTQLVRTIAGKKYSVEMQYDIIGRPSSIRYPDNSSVSYDYDGPYISSVRDSERVFAKFSQYSALGQPRNISYGNGVNTAISFYTGDNPNCPLQNRRVCTIATSGPKGDLFQDLSYKYDSVGNVTQSSDGSLHRYFLYDDFDRVVAAGSVEGKPPTLDVSLPATMAPGSSDFLPTLARTLSPIVWQQGFAYDEIGNMTWNSKLGEYRYPKSGIEGNHPHAVNFISGSNYSYDKNGNIVAAKGRSYFFGPDNRLSRVESPDHVSLYEYDDVGNRISEITTPNLARTFIGNLYECGGGSCYRFIYAGSRLIARQKSDSKQVQFIHQDILNSSTVLTNENGDIVRKFTYEVYGSGGGTNEGSVTRLYTGQDWDSSSGLYFYQSRFYDPKIGRFISPDSDTPDPAYPRNLNRYSYALNNPTTLNDPDGHFAWIIVIAGAILGGVNAAVNHDNVLRGMAMGAIGGAFIAGAAELGGGSAAQFALQTVAGAGGGATNAAIWGGDVGNAALYGAAFGAAGYLLGGIKLEIFGGEKNGLAGTANYMVNSGVHGALLEGAYGASTGRNVGDSITTGFLHGVEGGTANAALGHMAGLVAWAYGGKAPVWKDGAWFYESNPNTPGILGKLLSGLTLGNVVTGNNLDRQAGCYTGSECGGRDPKSDHPTAYDHELSHIPQSYALGFGYAPVNIISMFIGGSLAGRPLDFKGAGHTNGFMERYWIGVTDYDK